MKHHFKMTGALALAASAVLGSYLVGKARADGVPGTSMMYSGVLEDGAGNPVNGAKNITLTIYATSGSATAICSQSTGSVQVSNGRFQIPLQADCSTQAHANPNLWVELTVEGTKLPRGQLGVVPYALEVARASDLTESVKDGLVPPGSVMAFAGSLPPSGWLLCDGRSVKQVDYPRLYSAIGHGHGAGDGSDTFNPPDYRGRFLRGVDGDAGRDPDVATRVAAKSGGNDKNAVGSVQGDGLGQHDHTLNFKAICGSFSAANFRDFLFPGPNNSGCGGDATRSTSLVGGSENRPKNAYVNFIIRY